MSAGACVICGGQEVETLVTSMGERAYCLSCFHGWRAEMRPFDYDKTAMCSLGTSPERLDAQIQFFAPFTPENARILEIGCATGELAAAVRERVSPIQYAAIELSPAGEKARPHLDRLYTKSLRELLEEDAINDKFDMVLMSHVLEHLEDPAAEVLAMMQVLKPDGSLFLEVPNSAGHRHLPIDDSRAHLHFFSPPSMCRLLAKAGLEVVATRTDVRLDARFTDSLQVIGRSFTAPKWRSHFLSDHPALHGESDVVVWGAGSMAEEVLANFFDPERIDFFVDRDPARRASACLGRPVRAPEELGESPRTILVNSIDFAPSIAADIATMYPGVPHRVIAIGDLFDRSPGAA